MATKLSAAQLVTGNAVVINTGDELIVSITLSNIGGEPADKIYLTGATLAMARRLSPQNFPVFIGNLPSEASSIIGAKFASQGLAVGQKYLLTLRGVYGSGAAQGYAVSHYITIPPAQPYATQLLRAHVGVSLSNATWTYTVFNDEPVGSPLHIAAFHLDIVAPSTVTGTPPNWQADSDLTSYVGWLSDAPSAHIAPQQSLGGFQIQSATALSESTAYSLISWDPTRDQAGPVALDTVLSPSRAR